MIFGFKLRYLRHEHKKSYAELSKETGLSTSYLNDIEKGKKYPKPDKAELLAKSFNISYDEMVSTKSDKKIQPIIDFISSDFFKVFPSDEFGINMDKVLDVFTNAPVKTNAFISTILKIIRSYQIGQEDFYRVALRSYQDIHNNYFPEIEELADAFLKDHAIEKRDLELYLQKYGIKTDYETLSENELLSNIRAFYDKSNNKIHLNKNLESNQIQFQLLKEIGFSLLNLSERPYETILNQEVSFEKLLANFKASYFAIACLVPKKELVAELNTMSLATQWSPQLINRLISKFQVTPEMLLQRLTNILPHTFGANDLFFIKIRKDDFNRFRMVKELHLSRIHNPYNNQLNEHFCERWVSVTAINELKSNWNIGAQISEYIDHENRYFCITIAQPGNFAESQPSSVTIGMLITPELRATFNFLKDDKIRKRTVHTTCERCPLSDCEERSAPAVIVHQKNKEQQIYTALKELSLPKVEC